jgi:hypothetical protein
MKRRFKNKINLLEKNIITQIKALYKKVNLQNHFKQIQKIII